ARLREPDLQRGRLPGLDERRLLPRDLEVVGEMPGVLHGEDDGARLGDRALRELEEELTGLHVHGRRRSRGSCASDDGERADERDKDDCFSHGDPSEGVSYDDVCRRPSRTIWSIRSFCSASTTGTTAMPLTIRPTSAKLVSGRTTPASWARSTSAVPAPRSSVRQALSAFDSGAASSSASVSARFVAAKPMYSCNHSDSASHGGRPDSSSAAR